MRNTRNIKKLTAILLAITMLPFSDFIGLVPAEAETITTNTAEENADSITTNIEPVLENINLKGELNNKKVGISYEYDEVGRVIKATDQMGYDIHYSYDKNGNLLSITDQMGVEVESYTYNEVNEVATSVNALGNETTYTYNAYGELVKTVEKLNEEKSRTYTYAYDKNGELTKTTQVTSQGDITTQNIKDNKERTEKIIDANGGTTTYTYDALNRVISEVNAIGSSKSYTYNAVGLLTESKNARNQSTTYTYDEIGRITEKVDKLGTTSYEYDANGNVLKVTDKEGTIEREYDSLNRIVKQTDHNGRTIGYAYDELGNLISLTYPGGEIVRYEYYDNGSVKNVTDPKGRVTSYEYDPCGRLTKTTRANKTVEERTYDKAGLLLSIKEEAKAEVINDYEFTYDESGNITKISGTGNKSAITQNINCTMEYDAANRLICYNGEELTYDADGNMLKGVVEGKVKTLKYDCRNRLVSTGETTYKYNAENTRIKTETADKTTEYVTDVSGTLSRVLAEYVTDNETGETTYTIYVYGQGLISLENIVDDETTYDYYTYHYNHLGSTTAITDEAGNIVERYTYGTYVQIVCNLIGNGATFLRSGGEAILGAIDVVDTYIQTGEIDWSGVGAVGLNMLVAGVSGKATLSNGNNLRKMLSEDNVAGKFKNSLGNAVSKFKSGAKTFLADNRGTLDVGVFSERKLSYVETPYGKAYQDDSDEALRLKQYVEDGGVIYRG